MPRLSLLFGCVAATAMLTDSAYAKDITVQMKNNGAASAMVFEPASIKAVPGDIVHFMPTDFSHNAETIPTMLPSGVAGGRGAMNKEFVLKVDKPGLYGIKCLPLYALGMVALIEVGK